MPLEVSSIDLGDRIVVDLVEEEDSGVVVEVRKI